MATRFGMNAGVGARATMSGGALDMGYTDVVPPEMAAYGEPSTATLKQGTTWVALGALAVLAVLYVHWHTY